MTWQTELEADRIVLIDGGTGTELQRRGVPMDEIAWCGAAVLSHPNDVRATHETYLNAGAKVIIGVPNPSEVPAAPSRPIIKNKSNNLPIGPSV